MTIKYSLFRLLVGGSLFFGSTGWGVAQAQQNCNINLIANVPTKRFIDNRNGTLTDPHHHLMWKKCLEGQNGEYCHGDATYLPWESAIQQARAASNYKFAGHDGWRLPTLDELSSLVEHTCNNPASNLQVFPRMPSAGLWSSEQSGANAWSVDFGGGKIYEVFKAGGKHVRLVRDLRR